MYKYLLLLVLCLTIQQAAGTSQEPERIIIGRDTCDLATIPFKMLDSAQYAKFRKLIHKKNFHKEVSISSSSLWRDYTATWELRNDSLLFRSIKNTKDQPIDTRRLIAPGELAEWFSGELLVRSGEPLWSDDDNGFMEYEYETVYTVRNGG